MTNESVIARRTFRLGLVLLVAFAGAACVNTRVFSQAELSDVARSCGVAPGEVVQEPDAPRFLFLYAVGPTDAQLACVKRWSRKRNMHLAYIEAVNWNAE